MEWVQDAGDEQASRFLFELLTYRYERISLDPLSCEVVLIEQRGRLFWLAWLASRYCRSPWTRRTRPNCREALPPHHGVYLQGRCSCDRHQALPRHTRYICAHGMTRFYLGEDHCDSLMSILDNRAGLYSAHVSVGL